MYVRFLESHSYLLIIWLRYFTSVDWYSTMILPFSLLHGRQAGGVVAIHMTNDFDLFNDVACGSLLHDMIWPSVCKFYTYNQHVYLLLLLNENE